MPASRAPSPFASDPCASTAGLSLAKCLPAIRVTVLQPFHWTDTNACQRNITACLLRGLPLETGVHDG